MNKKKRRFNIVLDDDLMKAAKKRGSRLRKSIAEMVREQFVKWHLEEHFIERHLELEENIISEEQHAKMGQPERAEG